MLNEKLKAMIGFRNIAVHYYQEVSLETVKSIIEVHLKDMKEFSKTILQLSKLVKPWTKYN